MPTSLTCVCGAALELTDENRDKPVRCPACGHVHAGEATTAIQAEAPRPTAAESQPVKPAPVSPPQESRSGATVWIVLGICAVLFTCCGLISGGAAMVFLVRTKADDGQRKLADMQVNGPLTQATQAFFIRHNRYPESLEELALRDQFGIQFIEGPDQLFDPWGQEYKYDPAGPKNNGVKPDIWTVAPDGAIIGNWPGVRK